MLFGLIAVVGACLVFWSITYGRRRTVAVPKPADASAPAAGPDSPRSLLSGALARLAAPAMRGERSNRLQSRLNAAGLSLKAYEFVGIQLVCVFIVAAVGWFRFGNPLVALGGGVAGYFAPALYLRRVERKRKRTLNAQLGDTISLMSNGLKAGYSIQQALASVADTGRKPISDEIRRVVREMSLGIELETSLQHLNERLQSPDFDMMVTAILIHRRVGGNLAEVMDKIAETVRERIRVTGEVRVLTAQARASGYIVTGLPFAVAILLSLISPSFERPLFESPLGWGMISVGLVMIGVGYAIIRKITDIHL